MLILSRRPGDAILIDGGIRIVVLESDSRGVRIGIEAPAVIGIVREEIASPTVTRAGRTGKRQQRPVADAVHLEENAGAAEATSATTP